MKKIIISLIIVFTALFCCSFLLSNFFIKQDGKYFVKEGDNITTIAKDLSRQSVISSELLFRGYYKLWSFVNGCAIVHVGEYNIKNGEGYNSFFDKICNGKSVLKTMTIPEGFETREIVELLNNNEDLTGNKIVFFEEGKLLPESYSFKSGTKREILFEKIKDDFDIFVKSEWIKRDNNDIIKTMEDAIVLASIVEKEAKTDEERPIIASVYLNRLKINMRLEADPTTIYEITKGRYKLNRLLTKKDLQIKGEYNTYRKKGLPLFPICNPGKESIIAVLHPAKTDYLYFVAKEDLSGHYFANNYKDHLKNIKFVKSKNSAKR